MHAGVSHSFAATRKDFWIPQRRSSVRGVLLSCLRCRQYQRGPYRMPAMSPYPRSRIEESRSFHIQGSKIVKTSLCKASQPSATQKVWLHLFTCLTLRAIHLEVVYDTTAEQFLLCLRRFIATGGKPKQIVSNNASQFKVVKSTVEEAWQFSKPSLDTKLPGQRRHKVELHHFNWPPGWVVFKKDLLAALQAATILVAMASGKNLWRPKFWRK